MAANKNEYALHKDESWETALVKDRTYKMFHYSFFKNYKIAFKLKCEKKRNFRSSLYLTAPEWVMTSL